MMRRRATLLLGVVGLALLAAAAARVIYTSSGAGIVTLMIIGAVLLISPFVIARVERLSVNSRGTRYADSFGFVVPRARCAMSCNSSGLKAKSRSGSDSIVYLKVRSSSITALRWVRDRMASSWPSRPRSPATAEATA